MGRETRFAFVPPTQPATSKFMNPLWFYFNMEILIPFFKQYSEVSRLIYESGNVPVHGYGGLGSTVRTQQDTTHQVQEGANGGSRLPRGGSTNLLFGKIFAENCKNCDGEGEARSNSAPP